MNIDPTDPSFARFARHMVTLVIEIMPEGDQPTTHSFSGFLIWFQGKQWLITAAHAARDVRTTYRAGRLLKFFSGDAWANADGKGMGVIIPKDFADRFIFLTDNDSYDVAMLELGINLAAQINAGHVQAVPEEDWMNPPAQFDFYALLGTPEELVEHNGTRFVRPDGTDVRHLPDVYDLKRGLIEVTMTDRPEGTDATTQERFYGKTVPVPNAVKVNDIVGVSGGPIFGCVKSGGSFTHHVIAVQSGWFKEHKIVTADYLKFLPSFYDCAPK